MEVMVNILSLTLQAPLRLVQVWAWERFPGLRPEPNAMNHGEPRIARWHGLKRLKIENVRMVLDSAQDCFQWRPYATTVSNWSFPKFYIEKEEWMVVDSYLDQELQSFAQCLRIFHVLSLNPMRVLKLPGVTTSTWPSQAAFTGVIRQPRSLRRSRRSLWGSTVKKEVDDNAEVPPGFLHKYNMVYPRTSESYLRSSKGKKGDNDGDVPPGFGHRSNLIHQIEKTMQNEAVPRGSEGAAEAANESDVYNTPKMNDNEGQNRSYKAVEIPGLELEARISRLERVIAELKAERLAARLTSITKQ
ncbi:hypothetical protein CK203_021429 [Vitis vinifera]|uniref:Aminotransferase-like plant mobile domain-containing protein n=1 Tax=Vitis vinifera TaxID=29760 RepID=A0A438ISC3_VITVI|nr:hypothetical protein CK203_021429 [Vitis vinifera]